MAYFSTRRYRKACDLMTNEKRIFITGCSSGFGYLIARELAIKGHRVYASMRDIGDKNKTKKDELENFGKEKNYSLNVIECDVLDDTSVNAAIKKIVNEVDGVDVLINNAGYGIYGPIEYGDEEKIKHSIDTNVFGYIRTIKAILPLMRENRKGHIINISSVLGVLGLPMMGFYNACKFAIEGLSQALLGECYLFGIDVSIVNPHMFSTDFAGRSAKYARKPSETGEYEDAFSTLLEKQSNLINPKSGPEEVAKKVAWLVNKKNPPFRVPVGKNARRDMFFARWLNPLLLQKIAAKLYGMSNVFKKL